MGLALGSLRTTFSLQRSPGVDLLGFTSGNLLPLIKNYNKLLMIQSLAAFQGP